MPFSRPFFGRPSAGPAPLDAPPAIRDALPLGDALLAATIGHDIRNLMTAMSLAIEMAIDAVGDDHPARADLVEAIRTLKMADVLAGRLLGLGRDHGSRPVGPVAGRNLGTDVADVVRAIEPILRRLVDGDWALHLDLPRTAGRVGLDAASIESLVVNLVVNARDAQPLGGRIEVAVRKRREGLTDPRVVELSVADRGSGIAPEVRSRMFEPRVTTKAHGSGLGLAIVADVVQAAGGTVAVSDRPDGGTRFVVALPVLTDRTDRTAAFPGSEPRPDEIPSRVHRRAIEGEPSWIARPAPGTIRCLPTDQDAAHPPPPRPDAQELCSQ